MIHTLKTLGTANPEHLGRLGSDLAVLRRADIPIVETVLVEQTACQLYQDGALTSTFFSDLWSATAQVGHHGSDLFIRSSPPDDSVWCEDNITIAHNPSALRNAVERIFRSISSPRSRASRIAALFADDVAAAAIVIQEFNSLKWTVSSRHPRTGEPVNELNWADSIVGNQLPANAKPYVDLARRCEVTLGKPVQVDFDASHLRVMSVHPATMTDVARLEALIDLYQIGVIDRIAVLRQVHPWMLGYLQKYELDPSVRIGVVRGIDASPGQVFGAVALRRFDRRLFTDLPPVLCLDEVTPDDIHDIEDSAAVVAALGGKSSHAAVVCRGIGLPCVCGTGIRPHEQQRCVRLPTGSVVREQAVVAVDGMTGVAEFSDVPTIVPRYFTVGHKAEIVEALRNILNGERKSLAFKDLSVDDQKHLAALTHRMKELRLMQ